ncbi:DUF983 domain-containing protein [Sphingoaurantiacus capsulatus]|uniref:DUF983 domain-containing protein n=1 Tax=Sphingoaurantiacus capsulatus TaxID=1771310 RepID=A0ABV7X6H2_9SPHN
MTDPARAAARGVCPRCGRGPIYVGLLRFRENCPACGLDIAAFNVGDGPAAFLTLIIGGLVVGLALWLELALAPPWWGHALIWPPIIIVATIAALRVGKGVLLGLEYRHQAAESREGED